MIVRNNGQFVSEYGYGNKAVVALPFSDSESLTKRWLSYSLYDEKHNGPPSKDFIKNVLDFVDDNSDEIVYQFQQWDVCWWGFSIDDFRQDIWNPYEKQERLASEMGFLSERHKSHFSMLVSLEDGGVFLINGRGGLRDDEVGYTVSTLFLGKEKDEIRNLMDDYISSEYTVGEPPCPGAEGGWTLHKEEKQKETPRQFKEIPGQYEEAVLFDGDDYSFPVFCQERQYRNVEGDRKYLSHSKLDISLSTVYIGLGIYTSLYRAEISE